MLSVTVSEIGQRFFNRIRRKIYSLLITREKWLFAGFVLALTLFLFSPIEWLGEHVFKNRVQERQAQRAVFPHQLHILSTDMHISPIADLKFVASSEFEDIVVTDLSLSGACAEAGTCAKWNELKVMGEPGDLNIMYDAHQRLIPFFDAYREGGSVNSALVTASDAIHCSHPLGMCEYYMPFNRSLIMWSTTRFEQGRETSGPRLQGFIKRVRAMALQKGNALLANSVYDQHYVHYFTGLMPTYIPSLCSYISARYAWSHDTDRDFVRRSTILGHGFRPLHFDGDFESFVAPLIRGLASAGLPLTVTHLRRYYAGKRYEYTDLAKHPAMLHFPYQVSIMSFFEQYTMGIPIIVPSHALLTKWHLQYGLVSELTWDLVVHGEARNSSVPQHDDADEPFDPNQAAHPNAVSYWLRFADYYTFPHIIYFDDWDDLVRVLTTVDLNAVSRAMLDAGARLRHDVARKWKTVFDSIIPASARPSMRHLTSYEDAMKAIYGDDIMETIP
ncbi:MAG: hypothetical protein EOO65_00035 [Methanosarcinales archaeon]|nr:MAG: hypothetical protein EOO65_00035 [Methanosarcinales archaeon]